MKADIADPSNSSSVSTMVSVILRLIFIFTHTPEQVTH